MQAPAPRRDLTTAEARWATDLIFEGKIDRSIAFLDSMAAACDGEPLYILVKSRVLREFLTIDDDNKDTVKKDSAPILEDLDRLIAACDERMKAGDENPTLRLYRGVAWMFKSQVRSFSRSFWRAGRDAKKGKADLEAYLERAPGDNLALGTLGAFYYFADMIPGMFKFLSRLVLMPTGDREKGLRYIREAAEGESIFKTDFEILHFTVCFMFEGGYEEGLKGIKDIWERFPFYERAAAPSLLMRPLIPTAGLGDDKKIDALITRGESTGLLPRHEVSLLHFFRAYSARFYDGPAAAEKDLRSVAEQAFEHPDWVSDFARLELAKLWAAQGHIKKAHPILVEVGASGSHEYIRDLARDMLKDLEEKPSEAGVIDETWAAKVYRSLPADRRDVIAQLRSLDRPSLHAAFYLGDALLLEGDLDGALAVFEDILARDVPRWAEEYRMFAACRAAEIHGALGEYDRAARFLSRALDSYGKEYLLDWIIEGRQRYYERLAQGEDEPAPGLFLSGSH